MLALLPRVALAVLVATIAAHAAATCPGGIATVDTFELNGSAWTACEDLQQPGGAIALVNDESGHVEWFSKSHEQYGSAPRGSDELYYLGLGYANVIASNQSVDVLGQKLLDLAKSANGVMTWSLVASAIPPIRHCQQVRAIVGSRGAVVDTTFDNYGTDAAKYGFPPAVNYVFNLTNLREGGTAFKDDAKTTYVNQSGMAAGIVGGHLPIVVYYFPVVNASPYLPNGTSKQRYWTRIASAAPDMKGSREQTVWFRFVQIECATAATTKSDCKQIGSPQYWDTYWWSRAAAGGATNATGPAAATGPDGFYASLLENRLWWDAELAAEGMMELKLPSAVTTNGTQLLNQMHHQIIQGMITWHDTWGPRYGILPGYGINMQNGFEDTFTATATAALEVGAMPYATGLIDHYWNHYVRDDGLINYRAEEVAQQARMLTILALFYSYSSEGEEEKAKAVSLLLAHFNKAQTMAVWLMARRNTSLLHDTNDPRFGIIPGTDEGDDFKYQYEHQAPTSHWYASNAEAYRAFAELGPVWVKIGKAAARTDVVAHGEELLDIAPLLYRDLHVSLNKTMNTTASPGHVCYPPRADAILTAPNGWQGCPFRSYPEMFYSGALTPEQMDAMYVSGQGNTSCEVGKWLQLGTASSGGGGTGLMFVHIPQGLPFGLLQHDMVDRFLLYFFTQSAHCATRGTHITPESMTVDRARGGYAYASPGQANVAMAMKWMLCYEEPETRTLWLAKATPRDWLVSGEAPLVANNLTTRYGRISYTLNVAAGRSAAADGSESYTVHASMIIPPSFATGGGAPSGGIRLRLRTPTQYAGKLSGVTVGGKKWSAFNAAEETIDFAAQTLTAALIRDGLPHIVATFAGTQVPLRAAHFDPHHRVVPLASRRRKQSSAFTAAPPLPIPSPATTATLKCPGGITQVDAFSINGSAWIACEDLQQPGGALVLLSAVGDVEWFGKTYEPYLTNASDHKYYLGLSKADVASATTDILGAKLLAAAKASSPLTWASVERAIPRTRASGRGGSWGSNCKGTRTFVGSRDSARDTAMDDFGDVLIDWDSCSDVMEYVGTVGINKYNDAVGEPTQSYDVSGTADGLVGGVLPTALFYLPMEANGTSKFRYWTAFIVPVADMKGSREQSSWTRYQQVKCSGAEMKPPCTLITAQYWDTYWYSRYPGANASDTLKETLRTGPVAPASASGFYKTLLENRWWWDAELAAEGMHQLELPSPKTTNGTWLTTQATHAIVKSMISRQSTWQPRYGIVPGYGAMVYNGLLEVFTATATAALEVGAMPYALGVVDNHFNFYVRDDGMVWHRSSELPASARMLTVLELAHAYSGGNDSFVMRYFDQAEAAASLLIARHAASLVHGENDARYGIPAGGDDALHPDPSLNLPNYIDESSNSPKHWYASAAELYRTCTELGRMWTAVGKRMHRDDVAAHGAELLKLAPQIYTQLQASLKKTMRRNGSSQCWSATVEGGTPTPLPPSFRGFAEMLYSGAMTQQQVQDIYASASGSSSCGGKLLVMGSPGLTDPKNGGVVAASLETTTPYGLAYGLLQHDMVDEFLLHYFTMSAHAYTRGSWTTPASTNVVDRDVPTVAFAAAGEVLAPTYLKWMLCYEEPETRTLWLAKATPRDWLVSGEAPLVANNLTTRYGRISYTLNVAAGRSAAADGSESYTVHASMIIPPSFATGGGAPSGGIRLRLRTPTQYAGKLSGVTVGGKKWSAFNAAEETIDFAAQTFTAALIHDGLPHIVATFAGTQVVII